MSQDFVQNAIINVLGPIAHINAKSTRLELFNPADANTAIVIEATKQPTGAIEATLKGKIGGEELAVSTFRNEDYTSLTAELFVALPAKFFDEAQIDAKFTGVAADDTPMTSATGSSSHGRIVLATASSTELTTSGKVQAGTDVEGLLKAAVNTAVDYLASKEGTYARLHTKTGNGLNDFWWILLHGGDDGFSAYSNDMDFLAPVGPTFHAASADPYHLGAQVYEFLFEKYARLEDPSALKVSVYRESSTTGTKPALRGDVQSGGLAPEVLDGPSV